MWCYKSVTTVLSLVNLLLFFDSRSVDYWHSQDPKNLKIKERHSILVTTKLFMMAILRYTKLYLSSKLNILQKGL